ncbi:methyltransferase domain-containing protein [Cohnella cholangitidis]|uniref:Methyltransferase domain-containing protein n=2 Tax=Cohnella cholangitidis TaxID=2598458 RepID=A0A7G5BSB7_9BACL|nr:methyltransferase domain-containing protein [Cohnella cholangitidis]
MRSGHGLRHRSSKLEFMDDFTEGGEELREALRHLRRLNAIFGASGPALYGVKRLWQSAGKPDKLTILDVGSGSGDINRRILKWADRQCIRVSVVLADVTEEARAEAERLFRDDPRVLFVKQDWIRLRNFEADIVTASQFAHHFPTEQLPSMMEKMLDASRIGVVLNDIHRHWLPWAAVWIATRFISRNRYIRHDGPLSVAKGFRNADLRNLAGRLGIANIIISWRPLFRYAVVVPKQREAE